MTSRYLQNSQKQFYNLNQQLNAPCHNYEKVEASVTTVPNSKIQVKRWVYNPDLKLDLSDDEDVNEVINIDESDANNDNSNTQTNTLANNTQANSPAVDQGIQNSTLNSIDSADPAAAANQVIHPTQTEHMHEQVETQDNAQQSVKQEQVPDQEQDVKPQV
ncbi:hypothetical protein E3P99_02337 [Wallemia hederae]|uniref:Uncharacterized protein n=1 Tax=Wallemia hederae TaxID=1540922 RepID=A0A4T0FKK7_9BASI|nr:hypothetical protein E3P99_02337 [Wallemia hederae]